MRPFGKNRKVSHNLRAQSQQIEPRNDTHASDQHCVETNVADRSQRFMLAVWRGLFLLVLTFGAQRASAQSVWSMGYYYPQSTGGLPAIYSIDWTAWTSVVCGHLRERLRFSHVITVPAIKPACAASTSKLVSLLGT